MYHPDNKENANSSEENIREASSSAPEGMAGENQELAQAPHKDAAAQAETAPIASFDKESLQNNSAEEASLEKEAPDSSCIMEEAMQPENPQETPVTMEKESPVMEKTVPPEPTEECDSLSQKTKPDFSRTTTNDAENQSKTEAQTVFHKKQCYEEHIKKRGKKKNGWAKLIAGCLIGGIAAGSSIGIGYGAIQHYYDNEKPEVLSNSTTSYIQKTSAGGNLSAIDIIKKVKPSVVSISTKIEGAKQAFGNFYIPFEGQGAGSGVIFYEDNDKIAIVTNNHVIEDAKEVYITLENGTSLPAKVVGTKTDADLAVLTVSRADMKKAGISEVTVASFGKSSELEVGSPVIAIGNAMGMGLSATDGILSVTGLDIVAEGKTLHVMQTSAPINSGNSGGPLVNSAGEVIGINTGKYNSSMTEGMGYAIPSDTVLPIAEDLLTDGFSPSPHIGIVGTSITKDDASLYKLPVGTLIMEVTEGGPADKAGIQAGDIMTQFNGRPIMDMESLVEIVAKTEVGTSVPVHIIRNGETPLDVTLVVGDKNA